MTYLLYIVVVFIIVVIQTTLSMHFAALRLIYDLFLLLVVYLGFYRPLREGFIFIFICGFIMDSMSGGPFGLYLTSYLWLYLFILWITRFMRISNNMVLPLVVVGSILFQNLVILGTMAVFLAGTIVPPTSYQTVIIQLIAAIITGPVLILLFRNIHTTMEKWLKRFEPEYR